MTNLSIQRGLDIIESIMDKQQAMNEKQVKEIEQLTTERDRLKTENAELKKAGQQLYICIQDLWDWEEEEISLDLETRIAKAKYVWDEVFVGFPTIETDTDNGRK